MRRGGNWEKLWDLDHLKPRAPPNILPHPTPTHCPQCPQIRSTLWNGIEWPCCLSYRIYYLSPTHSWSWHSTVNMTNVLIFKRLGENKTNSTQTRLLLS